jgi:hypothetical protein
MTRIPAIFVVLLALATGARGQTAPALSAHSDSQYARELSRLKQIKLMEAQLAAAKGTPAENLWKAQLLQARYDDLTKDAAAAPQVTQDYLSALDAYVRAKERTEVLDGSWALDHAQFILTRLSQPILTRMEYFGSTRRDRETLAPLAAASDQMVRLAGRSLEASMKQLEAVKPFDEKAYTRAYAAAAETRYYSAWALYDQAMARDPAAPDRGKFLSQAADILGEWAVDAPDNGVNFQSYLLRGKVLNEAGNPEKALADFAKAQADKAPNWVQYQARHQTVVVQLRVGDWDKAQQSLEAFQRWIPRGNTEAVISGDLLGYRVAWANAVRKVDAVERRRAQRGALDALASIIRRDPRFRDLVYEQLAAQIPENADVKSLFPLQQLALARWSSENQKGDTPESRRQLGQALLAATAARDNPLAVTSDRTEAAFLLGVCHALLGELPEAIGLEVEFATAVPNDPRARQMVDLALQQIGELRRTAATQPAAATGTAPRAADGGGGLTPELRALAVKALDLSINTFGDKQWLYAQGRMFEESGQSVPAAAVYDKVAPDDRNYLEARYRLVALATERFGRLEGQAPSTQQKAAASDLFAACAKFSDLVDHPPASAPPEVLQAAQAYRYTIWLIEAATALAPAVRNPDVALDRLARLEAARDKLTESQRGTVLRYRFQAYQLAGQANKARQALDDYAKTGPEALATIRNLAFTAIDDVDKTSDSAEAQRLAGDAAALLNPIIAAAVAEGKKDNAFEYRLKQADMWTRAGRYPEARALAVALQKEREQDIRPFMAEARAMFAQARAAKDPRLFASAQDYFTRILKRLTPGSEAFWESWLRIIQSMEAQSADSGPEIKSRLGDLRAVYGAKFGGQHWQADFAALAAKYDAGK